MPTFFAGVINQRGEVVQKEEMKLLVKRKVKEANFPYYTTLERITTMKATEFAAIVEAIPYWKLLGMKVRKAEEGYAELYLPFHDELQQAHSFMHGGAIASLLDAAGAVALISKRDFEITVNTVEMKLNFLNPVTFGQKEIVAQGRAIKLGKTLGVSLIEVKDTSDNIIAIGTGTYIVYQKKG